MANCSGALAAALRDAANDDDVWAVALTGNGDAFCSGLDLDQDRDAATLMRGTMAIRTSASPRRIISRF